MGKKSVKRAVALSLDLGGTHLKSGVIDQNGRILHSDSTPSGSKEKKEEILQKILQVIRNEREWAETQGFSVIGVGIGAPGIVSFPQGVVHRSPHFPSWKDFPLRARLKEKLSFPFVLDNDANMAALGEGWKGAAREKMNFILLTLGTGIGGGLVLGGEIFRGDSGFAGELGHVVIQKEGRPCSCGGRGCLEMYASATGIREEWRSLKLEAGTRKGGFPTPEELYRMARGGNRGARRIWDRFGETLGAGIASILNVLDVETVIIGGGLSKAWSLFMGPARRSLKNHLYPTTAQRVRIKKATLGNNAGIVGAAREVFSRLKGAKKFSIC